MKAKNLGFAGETMAANFLKAKGYTILKNNFTIPGGELDLIAKDGETLVFVEVKTRSSDEFGSGDEQLTYKKRRSFLRVIEKYLAKFHSKQDPDWRADLIEIELDSITLALKEINHFEDIEL